MIRVLIVTDIRLYADGLAEVLARDEDIGVVGMGASLEEAIELAGKALPDVLLLDMAMHDSLRMVKIFRDALGSVHIVALGVHEDSREVIACVEAGVSGYATRRASVQDLMRAVLDAVRGELRCSPKIAAGLVERVRSLAASDAQSEEPVRLTPREMEIGHLIDLGFSNKEIAARLCIEVSTVKNHVHNMLEKLNVSRRGEAAARLRPLLASFAARRASLSR